MESGGGAFGAGKAGGQFDPVAYIKKPQVILRLVSVLFAIIVFGCIASKGHNPALGDVCLYNEDDNACNYGVTIGVLAFLGLLGFLFLDAIFDIKLSSIQHRKYVVLADIAFSGLWTLLWFVGFCYLTSQWNKYKEEYLKQESYGKNAVQAGCAFSFFSVITFGLLTFLAVKRYRMGIAEDFSQTGGYGGDLGGAGGGGGAGYDDTGIPSGGSAYGQYAGGNAGETGDPYQQPFGSGQGTGGQGGQSGYNPPTY